MNLSIKILFSLVLIYSATTINGQDDPLDRLSFLIGNWSGAGSGFGNEGSTIESSFRFSTYNNYIEVQNESRFIPTDKKPKGEHHIDKGFISFDKARKLVVFRQFNSEGYVNQYVLIDSLSNDSKWIFETEYIENFVPGGKAKWTINKLSENRIETVFDVSFPEQEYACFGTNILNRKDQ